MGPDPTSPPSRSSSLSFCPPPLVATYIPLALKRADAVRQQSRISLVVLFSIAGRRSATTYTYLRSHLLHFPFSFGVAIHSRVPTYQSTFLSLEALFLLGDKCKTKTYSPLFYSLCKYAGIAASMARVFSPLLFSTASSSPSPGPSSTFAILFTIVCIQHSANGYRGCHAAATGTTGCFTFPLEIASKLYRRCTCAHLAAMTFTSRLHVKVCQFKKLIKQKNNLNMYQASFLFISYQKIII